jgi:hypothetical protein
MADLARHWNVPAQSADTADADEHQTTAEDAAMVLSLIVISVLSASGSTMR